MIKYLGSKRLLLPQIGEAVASCAGARSVLDLFSGTSRVGHSLKAAGLRVHANDHNAYAHVLATTYVAADRARWLARAERVLAEISRVLVNEADHAMELVVSDEKLSLAIGRDGQNARLAARLTGCRIDIRSDDADQGDSAHPSDAAER